MIGIARQYGTALYFETSLNQNMCLIWKKEAPFQYISCLTWRHQKKASGICGVGDHPKPALLIKVGRLVGW